MARKHYPANKETCGHYRAYQIGAATAGRDGVWLTPMYCPDCGLRWTAEQVGRWWLDD